MAVTVEDTFNDYERDGRVYYEDFEVIDVIPTSIGEPQITKLKINFEFDFKDQIKSFKVIKKQLNIYDNLKIKHYIKFGEECSICYEPIFTKKSAYLTPCGHPFHALCIHKWNLSSKNDGDCPICRQYYGDYEYIKMRYETENNLDKLEEFWINNHIKTPKYCFTDNRFDCITGTNKNCPKCIKYRECKR